MTLTVRWLAGWYLGGRLPRLDDRRGRQSEGVNPEGLLRISVIVPARNEAATLPLLLASLAQQTDPPMQVIVVDDQSTDATFGIASRAGATVVQAGVVPPGWLGKPWACAQGAAIATGEVLVFLDADTVASPGFMQQLAPLLATSGSLVSIAPYHQTRRLYEQASALFNLVAIMGIGASSVRRQARVTGAFGPCVAMRARDYATIGGHAAVRHEVLEDIALARVCQAHGIRVLNVGGGALLRYRMYPGGPLQLVEGWSKNFAAGASGTPLLRLLAIVGWISALIETGLWVGVGVMRMAGGAAGPPWPYALFYVLFALQLWWLLRHIGTFGPAAIVHPLPTAAFLWICVRSLVLSIRGQVTWKGRTIDVRAKTSRHD